MKSSWLLRIFPRAWRDRYEEEFKALLDERPSSPGDTLDVLVAAGDAQIRYRQLPEEIPAVAGGAQTTSTVAYRRARNRVRWMAALYVNAILFVLVNLALFGVNMLTTPDTPWFIFPVWGWAMFLALHAATILRGRELLATHLAFFAVLNSGLLWINLAYNDGYWFQWPLAASGTLLIAHALIAFDITGYFGAHAVAYGLGLAQLTATAAAYPESADGMLTAAITWTTLLLCHVMLRFFHLSPLRATGTSLLSVHGFLFLAINTQLLVQDLIDSDGLWFYYPLLAWSVLLCAHLVVASGQIPAFNPDWEAKKRDDLAGLAGLASRTAGEPSSDPEASSQARAAITERVRELRILHLHVFVFTVGAAMALVLNLLTLSAGPWALWPLWGWGIVLAAHAGYVLSRQRLLGMHAALFVTVNAGLIAIDLIYTGASWFYWPLIGTTLALAIHIVTSRDTRRAIHAWESRRIATMID